MAELAKYGIMAILNILVKLAIIHWRAKMAEMPNSGIMANLDILAKLAIIQGQNAGNAQICHHGHSGHSGKLAIIHWIINDGPKWLKCSIPASCQCGNSGKMGHRPLPNDGPKWVKFPNLASWPISTLWPN